MVKIFLLILSDRARLCQKEFFCRVRGISDCIHARALKFNIGCGEYKCLKRTVDGIFHAINFSPKEKPPFPTMTNSKIINIFHRMKVKEKSKAKVTQLYSVKCKPKI